MLMSGGRGEKITEKYRILTKQPLETKKLKISQ